MNANKIKVFSGFESLGSWAQIKFAVPNELWNQFKYDSDKNQIFFKNNNQWKEIHATDMVIHDEDNNYYVFEQEEFNRQFVQTAIFQYIQRKDINYKN